MILNFFNLILKPGSNKYSGREVYKPVTYTKQGVRQTNLFLVLGMVWKTKNFIFKKDLPYFIRYQKSTASVYHPHSIVNEFSDI